MTIVEKYQQVSDEDLISRILGGETALYEVIIRRYNPYLFKIGKTYRFNQSDTEDLMQDTFISAYTSLSQFANRSSLKTWLVKIMLNHCYHKQKKFSYSHEIPSDMPEKATLAAGFGQVAFNTSRTVANNELKHILEKALLQIPESYRLVFTLRELNEMNIRETSEALSLSESNVKIRLKRAKEMLRKEIEKMYSREEIFEFNLIYCDRIVKNVLKEIDPNYSRNPHRILKKFLGWFRGGRR